MLQTRVSMHIASNTHANTHTHAQTPPHSYMHTHMHRCSHPPIHSSQLNVLVCAHFHQHALVQQQGIRTTTSTHHALPTHHTAHTNTPHSTHHTAHTITPTKGHALKTSYLLIVKMKASDCKVWVVLELKDFFRVLQF